MSRNRKDLARQAIAEAMKLRMRLKYGLQHPINIFDACERSGVSVLFQDIPSMEGLYMPEASPRPVVIVSSLRPFGRQAMTCGHELGHHIFKHGKQWDELLDERSQARRFEPEEFLADLFSASLQMPKVAVAHAFSVRQLDAKSCSVEDIFMLSGFFGVSFGAFVTHLETTLDLIGMKRAATLSAHRPKDIRAQVLGDACPQNLMIVDSHWMDRAVDVEVGDTILLPVDASIEGASVVIEKNDSIRAEATATRPGISRAVTDSGWSVFIRVMRKNYVGRAPFRFDEEVDDDE